MLEERHPTNGTQKKETDRRSRRKGARRHQPDVTVRTWFAQSLVSEFTKQKEKIHGNEFDRNFQRCGGNKLLAGCSGRFGTVFLRTDFPDGWLQSFFQANHRLFSFPRRSFGLHRSSALWSAGYRRRPQHFAG